MTGMTTDADALRAIDEQWAAAAREGKDADKIVSFWSDDAKVYPPGAPVVEGRQAIHAFVAGSLATEGFSISWEPSEAIVDAGGTMGYTTGRNRFTFPDAAGNIATAEGRYLTVWRKNGDGAWKCVIDIWNSPPEAT